MACFAAPVAEAVIATIAAKKMKSKEKENETVKIEVAGESIVEAEKIPFSRKLRWLSNMLWGGSALLTFEHIWHGEIVPWFPFLTGAGDPTQLMEMLQEVATTGVSMAVLVTAVWGCMVAVTSAAEKKAMKPAAQTQE